MERKKTRKLLLFVSLGVLIVLIPFLLIQNRLEILQDEVFRHLQQERDYSMEEIKIADKEYGNLPRFSIWITFEDEPHIRYQYINKPDGYVEQQTYELVEEEVKKLGLQLTEYDLSPNTIKHYESPKTVERRY